MAFRAVGAAVPVDAASPAQAAKWREEDLHQFRTLRQCAKLSKNNARARLAAQCDVKVSEDDFRGNEDLFAVSRPADLRHEGAGQGRRTRGAAQESLQGRELAGIPHPGPFLH